MNKAAKGIVVTATGGFYYVDTGENVVECRARGKFRIEGLTPLVGDNVLVKIDGTSQGYIISVEPRKNFLVRPPLANIDSLCIVCAEVPPVTDAFLVDKVCAVALKCGIKPVIVINKCDKTVENGRLYNIYKKTPFRVIKTSAEQLTGIDELKENMCAGINAFTGNSGVGKSSILNAVIGEKVFETGDISKKIGRGKHTTRKIELFKTDDGIYVADTPGFSSFQPEVFCKIKKEELQYCFPEFEPFIHNCRFSGCSHTAEIGCAVRQAADSGIISESRMESYNKMYNLLKNQKQWK